jgi:hypothetical protein
VLLRRVAPVLVPALVAAGFHVAQAAPPAPPVEIRVLSNRADLVSGGDALVEVVVPDGAGDPVVDVDGRDVTAAFAPGADGRLVGLVTDLRLGANVVTARTPNAGGARLTITNAPIGGPVFSGPQIQPWACQPTAVDAQCNQPPTYSFLYKPADGGGLQPYDPAAPPADDAIATTTTQTGETVPFIVRQEVGYIARDEYRIAVLYQPELPWSASSPQPQFNHKLVITHGASCDTSYEVGSAPDVLDEAVLGAGFVVMSHALNNAGHNCNIITQAESMVMTKERVIEQYGELRYTIGTGCSGGSLVQQQVANAYPGLYQGLSPQCSFTDAWSSAMQYVDYLGLLRYFEDPGGWAPGVVWDPVSIAEVLDHPNPANPLTFTTVIANSGDPSRSCPGVPDDQVYDPASNPEGVKCTLQDYMRNVFGLRDDGFANRAIGNTGIQYGLEGLQHGLLTPAQFVDINTKIGGLGYDGEPVPERVAPDLAGLQRAYTTGAVNTANHLDRVAIIDLRGPDPGAFHDVYRTYAMRERLLRNFGTAANQVLWRGQVPLLGDIGFVDEAIFALDEWLAAVEADDRDVPLARKILENRPAGVDDRCTNGFGTDLPAEVCDQTVAAYGTPRMAAGAPAADDTLQCQLKPLVREDYAVEFTDEQWAALVATFPDGVCDYTRPGVGFQGAVPWQTYQYADGAVLYGGTALGAPPRSTPIT